MMAKTAASSARLYSSQALLSIIRNLQFSLHKPQYNTFLLSFGFAAMHFVQNIL